MPAKLPIAALGVMLAAFGLAGCTTTSQSPQLAQSASVDETDAGFTIPLPDTVAVLPESAYAQATVNPDMAGLPAPAQPGDATVADATQQPVAMPGVQAQPALLASATPEIQPASFVAPQQPASPIAAPRGQVDMLIAKYAAIYEVPENFVRRVVNRESTFNPMAYNKGHWGLMQIKHATARGMGYDGPANGLLDAETNLKYAVKYLRGAWLVADGDENRADRLYQTGYYYDAKRRGMLGITGLGKDRKRRREPVLVAPALPVETPPVVDLPVALTDS
ncbi:lytic transglycosylase domain-containing protein [Mesorhizobium sp. Root552]|uniref:lytic transglycosylase domain-containing protein n=1 Tax=Mesorhizobium sp. Root552 TaxID=1736555 RepID=UPI001FCDE1B4|nr:lytic transglycosylase domain-containing protein [Mesorhizobium sp. Root552]